MTRARSPVVDDDPWTQRVVIAALREQHYTIATASDGVGAELDPGPALRHADALYHVLRWSAGALEFAAVAVDGPDEIRATTGQPLAESTRRLDETTADPERSGPAA